MSDKYSILRREKIKKWFNEEIKGKASCIVCGESDPLFIDYHHLRDKKYRISRMINKPYAKKTILKELEKCVPVCNRCHREIHAGRININDYLKNKGKDSELIAKEYYKKHKDKLSLEAKINLEKKRKKRMKKK